MTKIKYFEGRGCSCGHFPKTNHTIRDISVQVTGLELEYFYPIRFNTRRARAHTHTHTHTHTQQMC